MTKTFRNPIGPGPDPWIKYHQGFYYESESGGDRISMRRAERLGDLAAAEPVTIWSDPTPSRCTEIWAPEFYLFEVDGVSRWYGYYTASDGIDDHHRLHVIRSPGDDPMGPYEYVARLGTDPDDAFYAIDGTVLQTEGGLYLIWAGRPDHVLFIAPMANPWTVSGPRVHLPASGFGCSEVREGPVALTRHDRIFLVYSACDTGKPDYKLGMLVAEEGADLLDPASWRQHPEPVFTRCDENGVFGPGHNHFFTSPDGAEDWIVYHGKTTSVYTYAGRTARAQRFHWAADGTPEFGIPLSLDADIPAPSGE